MADQPAPVNDRVFELLEQLAEGSKRIEYFFTQQDKALLEEAAKDEERRAHQLEAQKALVERHERAIAAEERQAVAMDRIAKALEALALIAEGP